MRAITTKSQNENGDNFLIKGRQIYWMVIRHYQTNPKLKLACGIKHLEQVKYLGDQQLERFKNNWTSVVFLQNSTIQEDQNWKV